MSRRVVLLGGAGFIGRAAARRFKALGDEVVVYARPRAVAAAESELADCRFIEGDLSDQDAVIAAIRGADLVVHTAHSTVPASADANPAADVEMNIRWNVAWMQRLNEAKVGHIIYFSSGGTVYGRSHSLPITEQHPTNPIGAYGISKLALEKYVAMFAAAAGLPHAILRPANVYGPGQRVDGSQGVVGAFARAAVCGLPLKVWGTGQGRRDYLYIEDAVEAIIQAAGYRGDETVFNVGSGIGLSVLDIIALVRQAVGQDVPVEFAPARGFDVPDNVLDSSRLQRAVAWNARVSPEEGVAATVAWARTLG